MKNIEKMASREAFLYYTCKQKRTIQIDTSPCLGFNRKMPEAISSASAHLMKSQVQGAQGSLRWPLLAAAVLFVLFGTHDFPKPNVDDLFYVGPAINMANGGDFSNPLLARQNFPSHYFFVYPPFHAYAVYLWVSVFGVGVSSLLAFQNLLFFIIAATSMLILQFFRARWLLYWLVPLGVTAIFFKPGLRPEAFAVAATMAGYALFLYRRENTILLVLSFGLLFLGATAAPRNGLFAAAFILAASWEYLQGNLTKERILRLIFAAGIAFAILSILFLILVRFRLMEFYHTFHLHSSRLKGNKIALFREFVVNVGSRCLLSFALAGFYVVLSLWRKTFGAAERLCYGLAIAFFLSATIGGLCCGSGWYPVFVLLIMAAAAGRSWHGWISATGIVAVLLMANITLTIEVFGLITGKIDAHPPENAAVIRGLKSTPEHTVLASETVFRYVFDYHLPPGYLLYEFSAPFPGFVATDTRLRPEDTYILGPGLINSFNSEFHSSFPLETWGFLGVKNFSTSKYPRKAYIVTGRELLDTIAKQSSK